MCLAVPVHSHERGHGSPWAEAEHWGCQADVRPGQPAESLRHGAFLSLPSPLPPNLGLCLLPEFSRICRSLAELCYSTFHPVEEIRGFPSVDWDSASRNETQDNVCRDPGTGQARERTWGCCWPSQECSVPSWSDPAHFLLLESLCDTPAHNQ